MIAISNKYDDAVFEQQFDNLLQREHEGDVSDPVTMGTIRHLAQQGGMPRLPSGHTASVSVGGLFDYEKARPTYVTSMPRREFAGPEYAPGAHLFPMGALSALVALGAVGKTSLVMSIAAHKAAGRPWNNRPLKCAGVIVFLVEETEEECRRKFSAVVDQFSPEDRRTAEKNLLLVSCVGIDARLTGVERGAHHETQVVEEVVSLVEKHRAECGAEVELIFFDHLQGFTAGDLNNSETAVTLARAGNRIAAETGAAVVFTAHISKANIGATEIGPGFTVGSMAFENAFRQVDGLIPMTEDDAKKFAVANRRDYAWLGTAKNSYGHPDAGCWIEKRVAPKYHTVVASPTNLMELRRIVQSASDALMDRLVRYVAEHPGTTKNVLDAQSGEDGPLKASQAKVRYALAALLDMGALALRDVTDEDRQKMRLDKRVKQVLQVGA